MRGIRLLLVLAALNRGTLRYGSLEAKTREGVLLCRTNVLSSCKCIIKSHRVQEKVVLDHQLQDGKNLPKCLNESDEEARSE